MEIQTIIKSLYLKIKMQSNLDNKVSSLFKEKKQSNTKIRIKLYSDSEDNESDYDKNPL